jgi:hypothetical protein
MVSVGASTSRDTNSKRRCSSQIAISLRFDRDVFLSCHVRSVSFCRQSARLRRCGPCGGVVGEGSSNRSPPAPSILLSIASDEF